MSPPPARSPAQGTKAEARGSDVPVESIFELLKGLLLKLLRVPQFLDELHFLLFHFRHLLFLLSRVVLVLRDPVQVGPFVVLAYSLVLPDLRGAKLLVPLPDLCALLSVLLDGRLLLVPHFGAVLLALVAGPVHVLPLFHLELLELPHTGHARVFFYPHVFFG